MDKHRAHNISDDQFTSSDYLSISSKAFYFNVAHNRIKKMGTECVVVLY